MASGGGRQLAAQHSHSLEVWYAHIPGIRVLSPATVSDARGMMLAALQQPDPVFIFEHATLYPLEDEIDEQAGPCDIERAAVRRDGSDVTIVAFSASVARSLHAAAELAAKGIEAEVIDLRTLRPLDMDTVLQSLANTHRAVIVDESWRTHGLGAEISARIMEEGFDDLDAPVDRVCSLEIPMPYSKHLEDEALPSAARIVSAVERMLA
jgi:pyruvate/2-oxoglutarate/acetoin dehydrogenase E1 component